jgi:hypothetical protein
MYRNVFQYGCCSHLYLTLKYVIIRNGVAPAFLYGQNQQVAFFSKRLPVDTRASSNLAKAHVHTHISASALRLLWHSIIDASVV